jgi:O-antigen/teichoic acid export membrane protein
MLRTIVLLVAIVLAVIGAVLCLQGVLAPGIQTLTLGVVAVIGVLFERWRYQNKNASRAADWQRTGERFVDPASGQDVEVLYDPRSGERRYVPLIGSYDKPD